MNNNQLPAPIHPEVESDEDNSNYEVESDEDNGGFGSSSAQRLSRGDTWCDEEINALDSGVEKYKHIPPIGDKRWNAILDDPVFGKVLAKRNASAIRKKYNDLEERRKKLIYKSSVGQEVCRKRKRTVDKVKVGVKIVDTGKNVAIDSKNIGQKGDEGMDIDEDISATRIANFVVKKLDVDRRMEVDIDEDPNVSRIANLVVKKLVDDDRFVKRVAYFVYKAKNVAVVEESNG